MYLQQSLTAIGVLLQSQSWSEYSKWPPSKPAVEAATRRLKGMLARLEPMDADTRFIAEFAEQVRLPTCLCRPACMDVLASCRDVDLDANASAQDPTALLLFRHTADPVSRRRAI